MKRYAKHKLTLDQPEVYQIKVPGHLDGSWLTWAEGFTISTEFDDDGLPITTLTSTVDQAALQSLLRQLYSLGVPLISVNCTEIR